MDQEGKEFIVRRSVYAAARELVDIASAEQDSPSLMAGRIMEDFMRVDDIAGMAFWREVMAFLGDMGRQGSATLWALNEEN
jgi:hypothetical protein